MRRVLHRRPWLVGESIAITLTLSACTDGSIFDDAGNDTGAAMDTSADGADSGGVDGTTSGAPEPGDSSAGGDETAGTEPPPPPADLSGEELFTLFCAACHGPEGEGSDLGYEIRHHAREHFDWVVRNGRPGLEFVDSEMTAFNEQILPADSLDKIYEYLDAFPQPDTSETLYLDYCGNCHGSTGNNGLAEEIIGKPLNDVTEKVRQGENLGDVGNRAIYMPRFDTSRISDAELQLIVDFISG